MQNDEITEVTELTHPELSTLCYQIIQLAQYCGQIVKKTDSSTAFESMPVNGRPQNQDSDFPVTLRRMKGLSELFEKYKQQEISETLNEKLLALFPVASEHLEKLDKLLREFQELFAGFETTLDLTFGFKEYDPAIEAQRLQAEAKAVDDITYFAECYVDVYNKFVDFVRETDLALPYSVNKIAAITLAEVSGQYL